MSRNATAISTVIAACALSTLADPASADTVYWQAGPDTQWTNPANWIGHVPGSNDFVVILPGAGPLIQGIKQIGGLYVQPGAGIVIVGELDVLGGASVQGSMSIAGANSRFVHRDDVNLEGTITMWDGSFISRMSTGSGTFTVQPSGTILIPSYDTRGVTLSTNMQVYGYLRHESTHTLSIGQYFGTDAASTYLAIQENGAMSIAHGGDIVKTYVTTQSGPYIANSGLIDVTGDYSDVVDISGSIPVFNSGIISVNEPDMYIHNSHEIAADGTLTGGKWFCSNYGRIFFSGNPAIRTIGPNAWVKLQNSGSTILPRDQIIMNQGHIDLEYGANLGLGSGVNSTFTNFGTMSMDQGCILQVAGQFRNAAAGVLDCWIGGNQVASYAHIEADSAVLAGTMNARVTNSYTPVFPDRFDVVQTAQNLNGTFDMIHTYNTSYPMYALYSGGTMSLVAGGCSADFNLDGVVDFFDYLDFVDAFSTGLPRADFNSDSVIDFFDYLDFVDAFSHGC